MDLLYEPGCVNIVYGHMQICKPGSSWYLPILPELGQFTKIDDSICVYFVYIYAVSFESYR